jgi:uncharacterized protein (DUF2384 family)
MTNTQQTTVPDLLTTIIADTDSRNKFYGLALEIFGTDQEIEIWIYSTNPFFGDERPLDLLNTTVGVERILTYLAKIESGTYV